MPIRTNRAYNDPNIGAAFENIAQIFAPPSASDTYAYAKAKAEREEADRAEEAFRQMTAEGAAPDQVDRFGVAIGRFNPTQSYRALEMGDATLRRGQEIDSGDRRYATDKSSVAALYGHDRTYQASTENNAADNVRALTDREMQEAGATSRLGVTDATDRRGQDVVAATSRGNNEADNARALQDRRMQEDGALARFFAAPVTVKQGERAYLPGQTAVATGLPAQLDGNTAPLSTDEVAALAMQSMPSADREQFVRDKFAPTDSQVQGQERRDLRSGGLLSDDDLKATIMGSVPVEEAIGSNGQPQFVRRADAIGMRPAPKSPTVSVTTGAGEGAFDKTLGENQAKLFLDLSSDGVQARDDLALINRLGDQMKDLPGGMLGGLQSVASRWGIKLGDNASNAEAADAIIARLVPAARQGLPGAASDRDVALFKSSLPSLGNTKEGAAIISDTLRGLAQARADRARIATAVVNGDMTRAQGMSAIQDLPDPFARLRQAADDMGVEPGPYTPRGTRPAGPTVVDGYTIEAID